MHRISVFLNRARTYVIYLGLVNTTLRVLPLCKRELSVSVKGAVEGSWEGKPQHPCTNLGRKAPGSYLIYRGLLIQCLALRAGRGG